MKAIRKISSLPPMRSGEEMFEHLRDAMRKHAHEARERSVIPYRDFRVGVSALIRFENSFTILTGANRKLVPGICPHRRCGEMEIIDRLKSFSRFGEVIGYYIAAPPQPDDMSKEDRGALIPCVFCRNRFRLFLAPSLPHFESRQHVTWDTRFICENIETGEHVPLTMTELMEIGKDDEASMIYIS